MSEITIKVIVEGSEVKAVIPQASQPDPKPKTKIRRPRLAGFNTVEGFSKGFEYRSQGEQLDLKYFGSKVSTTWKKVLDLHKTKSKEEREEKINHIAKNRAQKCAVKNILSILDNNQINKLKV